MAFCPNCGTQTPGSFCPSCGSAVSAGASASPSGGTSAGATPQYQAQPLSAPGISDSVAGALCYLGLLVTGIIFLLLAPYSQSKFVRFHAFQSILLHVTLICCFFAVFLVGDLIHVLAYVLYLGLFLGGVVLWLYMMYAAFNSHKVKLPLIGDLAEKQA